MQRLEANEYKRQLEKDFIYFVHSYMQYDQMLKGEKLESIMSPSFRIDNNYYINNQEQLDYLKQNNLKGCTFIVDISKKETLTLNCVSFVDCKVYLIGNDVPNLSMSAVAALFRVVPEYCFRDTSVIQSTIYIASAAVLIPGFYSSFSEYFVTPKNTLVVKDCIQQLLKHKFPKEYKENLRNITYDAKSYKFADKTVVVGVELELPITEDEARHKFDGRLWIKDTDGSQIRGYIELVSRPLSLDYVRGTKFERQMTDLWKRLETVLPDNENYYSCDGEENGSGIHCHISWEPTSIGVDSLTVANEIYKIVEARGGEKWLLSVGGKSEENFNLYSPFEKPRQSSDKYIFVHLVNSTHIEMRWGANSPHAQVALTRVRAMTKLFEQALKNLGFVLQ